MDLDFSPFFKKYEKLLIAADTVFERVKGEYPDCVKCAPGCSDCCHALFDLTLIEALYLNQHFKKKFQAQARESLIEKANRADRDVYKIKRKAYKDFKEGKKEDEILAEMATERVRCPLLNESDQCDLYEYRPITCRFYGIPTAIGGKGHTCGISGFVEGQPYPTVNLDMIHQKLYEISESLVKEIGSKHSKMGEMLVPLSMAMLTVYDDVYLGLADEKEEAKNE
ncbi:MAG: hypothetical protein B6245_06915 [Desulfobacteraceae bacterium 4572_88]|nr:MAG: hypothetical protein B6245_06915 [Desulfobacteraceae bacterium 4572_88]RLC18679.1 MAG: YkgJ family cysteine cluster protein [Deltaproteobacteria bacterium]